MVGYVWNPLRIKKYSYNLFDGEKKETNFQQYKEYEVCPESIQPRGMEK